MANTPSSMIPLGFKALDFKLLDVVSGAIVGLHQLKGVTGTVVMFICNHCPFVKHVNSQISKLGEEYQKKGIGFIAISSNDVAKYPQDGPEHMKTTAESEAYPFPYLYDENQNVAKAFMAACTPDFFLFDAELKLVYRGQLDDSRPGNGIPPTGTDLRDAMNAVLNKTPVPEVQKPSLGCNIKWKPS